MGLTVKKSSGTGTYVDPDSYVAMIKSCKLIPAKANRKPEYGDSIQWTIMVKGTTKEGEPLPGIVEMLYWTPAKLTEKNKLGKLMAAVGVSVEDIEDGEDLDLEEAAVRKKIKVIVEDNPMEDKIYSKITTILPYKKVVKKPKDEDFGDEVEDEAPPEQVDKKSVEKEEKKREKSEDDDDDDFDFDMNLDDLE